MASDLVKRAWQHKNSMVDGFTKKYHVKMLVYFEVHHQTEEAISEDVKRKMVFIGIPLKSDSGGSHKS